MTATSEAVPDAVPAVPSPMPRESLRTRLVKGSAYAFSATILGQVFALTTSIVYARLLGRDNLGVLAIYAQLASVFVAFAALGLGTPITRFVARLRSQDPEKLSRFVSTVLTVTLAATAAVSIGLFLLADAIGQGVYASPELVSMVRILALFLALNSLSSVGIAILQGLQRIRWLSVVGIFLEALGIPVMFVFLTWFGLVGAALGGGALIVVASTLLFGSAWRDLGREGIHVRLGISRASVRDLATYALPLLASTMILKVAFLVQTSLLVVYLGYGDAGLFRVASTVSRIVAFVSGSISVPLLPAISELYATASEDHSRSKVTTILRITAYAGVPAALGIGLFAGIVIGVFYGDEYAGAAHLAFVLVLAGFLDIIGVVAANSLLGEGRTRTLLALDVLQVGVIIAGTALFVTSFGLLGAGYAALLNSVAYCSAILLVLGTSHRVELRRVAAALLPAAGAFVLAILSILLGNAQANLWLAAVLVASSAVVSWISMAPRERQLFRGVPGLLLRRGVS